MDQTTADRAWLLVPAILGVTPTLIDKPIFLAGKAVRMARAVDDAISQAVNGLTELEQLRKSVSDHKAEIQRLNEALLRQDRSDK